MAQVDSWSGSSREDEIQEPSHPAGEGPSAQTERGCYPVVPFLESETETWSDTGDPGDDSPSGYE